MLRGSGVLWDLRLIEPYDCYELFDYNIPIGVYVIRMIDILLDWKK
jgi:NADH:ubiquinone oxidoreductase subunit D